MQFCLGTYSQSTFTLFGVPSVVDVVVSGFDPYLGRCSPLSPVSSVGKKLKIEFQILKIEFQKLKLEFTAKYLMSMVG